MPVIGMTIVDEAHAMREGYRQKNGSLQATSMCRAVIASKYAKEAIKKYKIDSNKLMPTKL